MEYKEINIDEIDVSEFNTRKDLEAGTEDTGLNDLSESIKDHGLFSPITVRQGKDNFELIAGQRRYLACKLIGMKTIPAMIRTGSDDTDATIISLIENVHRADMSPLDKANAYQKIYEKYPDYNSVSKQTGVSAITVKKYLDLLKLAPEIQLTLTTNDGPSGIGALSRLAKTFTNPDEQKKVFAEISGFKQNIQEQILRKSEGDISTIPDLRTQALEGAFTVKSCSEGLCFFMSDELKDMMKKKIEMEQSDGEEYKIELSSLTKKLEKS